MTVWIKKKSTKITRWSLAEKYVNALIYSSVQVE